MLSFLPFPLDYAARHVVAVLLIQFYFVVLFLLLYTNCSKALGDCVGFVVYISLEVVARNKAENTKQEVKEN